ncbi:MAG: PAS domain-containing protein, partial [Methylobacterium sp.]
MFRVIQGDVGRPLADLAPRALDSRLVEDAQQVLATHRPRECEISTITGDWFIRRILPYRSET